MHFKYHFLKSCITLQHHLRCASFLVTCPAIIWVWSPHHGSWVRKTLDPMTEILQWCCGPFSIVVFHSSFSIFLGLSVRPLSWIVQTCGGLVLPRIYCSLWPLSNLSNNFWGDMHSILGYCLNYSIFFQCYLGFGSG